MIKFLEAVINYDLCETTGPVHENILPSVAISDDFARITDESAFKTPSLRHVN